MHTAKIIVLDSKNDYYSEFLKRCCNKTWSLYTIPVIIKATDFDHIFSEKNTEGERLFSIRRARRLDFIPSLLDQTFPREVCFEPSTGNIAIFSVDLECVMYLRPRPKNRTLQITTFFDFGKKHDQMYRKQKKKTIEIEENKIEAVVFGLTTSGNADNHL
jgi:hypothetical protein